MISVMANALINNAKLEPDIWLERHIFPVRQMICKLRCLYPIKFVQQYDADLVWQQTCRNWNFNKNMAFDLALAKPSNVVIVMAIE